MNTPTPTLFADTSWSKSSYSAADNECVEVAVSPGVVGVRDSKDLSGPVLVFSRDAFADLTNAVCAGELIG